jgi:hypothetical protein
MQGDSAVPGSRSGRRYPSDIVFGTDIELMGDSVFHAAKNGKFTEFSWNGKSWKVRHNADFESKSSEIRSKAMALADKKTRQTRLNKELSKIMRAIFKDLCKSIAFTSKDSHDITWMLDSVKFRILIDSDCKDELFVTVVTTNWNKTTCSTRRAISLVKKAVKEAKAQAAPLSA